MTTRPNSSLLDDPTPVLLSVPVIPAQSRTTHVKDGPFPR